MNEIDKLNMEYAERLGNMQFDESTLDYTVLEKHIPLLDHLSVIGNSGITIFDSYKREHAYTSANYYNLFGFDLEQIKEYDVAYFDSKVHPDDLISLMKNGLVMMDFYATLPLATRTDYKLINEYRVLNQNGDYMRVIEQHQVLEQDAKGNVWLGLSIMDIAPDQGKITGLKSQIINFKNGEIVLLKELQQKQEKQVLSVRELAILNLIRDGLLSKEISDMLSISVHTVNTHRQRILEKLNASNTVEALNYATRLGLLS